MSYEHAISDELLKDAIQSFSNQEHWVVFNTIPYFLDRGDMYFFKTADEAHALCDDNISEFDKYKVIHASSADELLRQVPYGEQLQKQMADPDGNGLLNKEGNAFTDELIDHWEQQQIEKKAKPEEEYKKQVMPKMLEKNKRAKDKGLSK